MSSYSSGPWYPPHFIDDSVKCNCTSVVDMGHAGGIARIAVHNGIDSITEGGNDAPVVEQAKANARLIAMAPTTYEALMKLKQFLIVEPTPHELQNIISEIHKIEDLVEGRKKFE